MLRAGEGISLADSGPTFPLDSVTSTDLGAWLERERGPESRWRGDGVAIRQVAKKELLPNGPQVPCFQGLLRHGAVVN